MSKYDWQFKDLTIFDERCSLEVLKKSYNNVCSVCTGYGCLTCNESGETKP